MKKDYIPAFNYDFLTPFYDFFVELIGYGKKQRLKIIDLLKLQIRENLLDVGCGTGILLVLAKKQYPHIAMTGIDIDPKVLDIARNKTQKANLEINYEKTSSASLPFADSSFSVVVSTLVFHHIPTEIKKQTLKEIHRVLKNDGRFLLADFGKKEGVILYGLDFITKLFHLPESITLQDNLQGKISTYMKEAGFKVKEIGKKYKGIQFLLAKKYDRNKKNI